MIAIRSCAAIIGCLLAVSASVRPSRRERMN